MTRPLYLSEEKDLDATKVYIADLAALQFRRDMCPAALHQIDKALMLTEMVRDRLLTLVASVEKRGGS
jgi:hypothetical protein